MPLVRASLLLLAVTSVLGGAYTTLLPVVAGATLHGGPHTLGILMARGRLRRARRRALPREPHDGGRARRRDRPLDARRSARRSIALRARPERVDRGAAAVRHRHELDGPDGRRRTRSSRRIVDPTKLGRVMSLYAVAFFGGMPVGALLEGSIADYIGPMHTFLCAGIAVSLAGLVYLRALPAIRTASRPLYIRLGLIKGVVAHAVTTGGPHARSIPAACSSFRRRWWARIRGRCGSRSSSPAATSSRRSRSPRTPRRFTMRRAS